MEDADRSSDIEEAAALRGAAADGQLLRYRSSTMPPHRLRRGAFYVVPLSSPFFIISKSAVFAAGFSS